MEKRNKMYIPVVRDQEKGSWAYRGAAGRKETLKNIEALGKLGVQSKDIDLIPVVSSRRDQVLRAATIISAVLGIIDLGTLAWKYYKKKKESRGKKNTRAV